MVITSIENNKIKEIKKLYQKKYRTSLKMFIVEGEHLVYEALKSGCLINAIIEEGYSFDIDKDNIYVSSKVMNYISELDHNQHIMGICKIEENKNISDRILILDNIQDPGNLGTIIRSAVAFNIDTIILSSDTVDLYNPKVIRATQGMLFKVNIIVKDLDIFIPQLKNNNYYIYGTNVNGGKSLKSIEKRNKFAIIMGNEGKGVKEELKQYIDENIYIDMNSNCESLNVAIATSIILYEFNK